MVVGDATGRVLATARGPGSSPHSLGLPGALELLDRLVGGARATAGSADAAVDQAAVVPGRGRPADRGRAAATPASASCGWAPRTTVDNDTFALLRAGTAAPDAVAVVCGAGINCVGPRGADGRTARFPALGPISGDWGGGHDLAQLALWHAARAEDGRGAKTALADAVIDHFGLSSVEEVGTALHLGDAPMARLHGLSQVLFTVADAGDPVANKVVRRQADEIVALVRVAGSRLDLLASPFAVVLGGGVLRAQHPLLHDAVVSGVADIAPRAVVTVTAEAPVVGAALLALDELHGGQAPDNVEQALRGALYDK